MSEIVPRIAGHHVSIVPLHDGLVIGRGGEAGVQIVDTAVSRKHASISRSPSGWLVRDLGSTAGTRVNGRLFQECELTYGDVLQIGACYLRFDGIALQSVPATAGARVLARSVVKRAGEKQILRGITLAVEPGRFAGILGTSGAGKSTLLDALSGIRPATSGEITLGGMSLRAFLNLGSTACGYVPQDDIVHLDLTVAEAIEFSARLRLGGNVPANERAKLVQQTLAQLGLVERANIRIHRLSGGQRKRVSIAAEVLAHPFVLFLDEPSSGLDPATEFKLMELLRELANLGCTVICTTHVMENVYLFDQLIIVVAGRLVYSGTPKDARSHFDIEKFVTLYDRLEERPPEFWEEKFAATPVATLHLTAAPVPLQSAAPRAKSAPFFRIMLARQWALLRSNPRNIALLLGQPILIGILVAWMADTVSLKLFLAYLATFWFGCSNAAQEIVKEFVIYRRERIVGLGRNAYLLSKFTFWGSLTILQSLLLFICVQFGSKPLTGSAEWQALALLATAASAVGIGTAISSLVRTVTQAVMIVPLILLPQIVFSGYVLPSLAKDGAKKTVCEIMPSYSSQQIMDVSVLWREKLTMAYLKENHFAISRLNLEEKGIFGTSFEDPEAAKCALAKLGAWLAGTYLISLLALASKERSG